jgi:hypothetical protein
MKYLIMQFHCAPFSYVSVRCKYSHQFVLSHFQSTEFFFPSVHVRDQIPDPYEAICRHGATGQLSGRRELAVWK